MNSVETVYGLNITNLDADYQSTEPIKIWSIKFYPSATTDHVDIKLDTGAGEMLTTLKNSLSTDPVIEYFPPGFRAKIFFDYSESSIATSANAGIAIIFRRG